MDNELLIAMKQMLDEAIQPLKEGQAELKKDLTFVHERVVVIEVEHGNKLGALLDGHVALNEKLDGHTERLDSIEAKIDNLEITVGVHDIKLEKLAK